MNLTRLARQGGCRIAGRAVYLVPLLAALLAPATARAQFTPSTLAQAYGMNLLSANYTGAGQTIAIIDAYGAVGTGSQSNLYNDVAQFDSTYLPAKAPALSLTVMNENGDTTPSNLPAYDASWAQETTQDVEYAHAMAPGAKIEVVEAASNNYTDLFAASSYAASNGASVVSMSFSGDEDPGQDYNFNTSQSLAVANYNAAHPGAGQSGVLFVASTGDGGSAAGVGYPASNPYVVSVGGTALYVNANGSYSSETAWAGSGGGPSLYQLRPAYQNSVQTGKYRTEPDVAFDAANSTGVNLVFGGLTLSNKGGTSLGAPCWAALFALADQERVANGFPVLTSLDALNAMYATYNSPIYSQAFNDVVGGTNGAYYATVGYDEVTGLGSPIADYLVPYLAAYDTPEPASGAMIVLGWSLMLGRRKRR